MFQRPSADRQIAQVFTSGVSARQLGRVLCLVCVLAVCILSPLNPVRAQASATVTIQNDDRFRGRSVSEGEPVAILFLAYDLQSGLNVGGSVTATTNGPGVGVLRGSAHVGYATFVGPNVSLDGGAVFYAYSDRYSGGRAQEFAEVFAGINVGNVALHAWYSPSYLDQNLETLYLEANAVKDLGEGFRINARAGLLTRLSGSGTFGGANTRYDTQIGVTKDFDALSISVSAGTAGSGRGQYFDGPWQGRNSIVIAVSRSF